MFETFCDLLETVPVKAIVRAADAERRMLQDDLAAKRTPLDEESMSVLEFCNFLIDAAHGLPFLPPVWPTDHSAFYQRIIQRLIDAGGLPAEVKIQLNRPLPCTAYTSATTTA